MDENNEEWDENCQQESTYKWKMLKRTEQLLVAMREESRRTDQCNNALLLNIQNNARTLDTLRDANDALLKENQDIECKLETLKRSVSLLEKHCSRLLAWIDKVFIKHSAHNRKVDMARTKVDQVHSFLNEMNDLLNEMNDPLNEMNELLKDKQDLVKAKLDKAKLAKKRLTTGKGIALLLMIALLFILLVLMSALWSEPVDVV